MTNAHTGKKVILTGMRTTGSLHLGHYVGALENWLQIQNEAKYECYFLLADIQALTTHSQSPEILRESVRNVVLDWLSVGLDPTLPHVHFVLQSQVPERHELSILLQMIANYNILMDNPTLKTELTRQKEATVGFMTYPVDQCADIYMVSPIPPSPGDQILVPVGEDQIPHLEYARDVARKFNSRYGHTLVPCSPLKAKIGRLVGTDANEKMGKSTNNAIFLCDSKATVTRKIMRMYSDPQRQASPAIQYLRAFNPCDATETLIQEYQSGNIGDKELKETLLVVMEQFLEPIRMRRASFEQIGIHDIVVSGTEAARTTCKQVIKSIRSKMYLEYPN
jgi:tryptophanyl-tRNA synthetase